MKRGPASRVSPDQKKRVGNKGPWRFVGANRCNCFWVSSNHPSPAEADRSLPARRPLRACPLQPRSCSGRRPAPTFAAATCEPIKLPELFGVAAHAVEITCG